MVKIKVIVTGGAGFIGSHLTNKLIREGYDVHVIDNLSTGSKSKVNPNAKFYKADITNLKEISPIFKDAKFVFHLAALPRVQLSIDDPIKTHKVNVNGTLNVLMAAKEAKVKRVIYSASSSAYGEQKKLPLKEDMQGKPLSPYGFQKYSGEHYCRIFSSVFGLETVSLRYFNVYGKGMSEKGSYLPVFVIFLKQKKEGKALTIIGDGKQKRSFTNVSDVVNANILAIKSAKVGKGEVINICADKAYSINEVAKLISKNIINLPERSGEIKISLGSNALAKKLINWKPQIGLKEGLEELKEFYI
ncbi:MAG: NAD-dependent epimerase/dehydratase family protein [bacterium]|nr:NAD-dependent epimerase/dehydratase family protein [bacterium]